jgi:hypothetical protein
VFGGNTLARIADTQQNSLGLRLELDGDRALRRGMAQGI